MLRKERMFQAICLAVLISVAKLSHSWPLSTNSRWIIDQATGSRVKLACGNWPSHLQPMIAEGLEKKPLSYIVEQISSLGFNCVRFTWATYMFTRANYTNLTASQSLDSLGLTDAKAGIAKNNPELLNLTVVDVHKAVVDELGAKQIMVVLDNHVSLPQWCCGPEDGNGFFGDTYFDPQEWLQGLKAVATRYKGNSAVVGMSMRNELRGSRQNEDDWYKYTAQGAAAIQEVNPEVLVIVSGLSYDTTLGFLGQKPLGVKNITGKLVYEVHWYSFSEDAEPWISKTNEKCAERTQDVLSNSLFLVKGKNPVPLFLSEFGTRQNGEDEKENRYLTCLLATVSELDIDWAIWTLQGSYILREGTVDSDELYGMFDYNWDLARNVTMLERLKLVQHKNQDPGSKSQSSLLMYHPQSGQCVSIHSGKVVGATCQNPRRWNQVGDGSPIKVEGSGGCLRLDGEGLPAVVSDDCAGHGSKWSRVSASMLHLAAQDKEGNLLCLELNPTDITVITKKCLCIENDLSDVPSCADNPQRQWFKLVPTNA